MREPRNDGKRPARRDEEIHRLETRLGYRWKKLSLLYQALRHPSSTRGDRVKSNQRMEFMGDSVLDLVVAMHLMKLYPQSDEGFLTQLRVGMVRDEVLADKGRQLGLPELMEIQETAPHLRELKSSSADCMEAVIGSAFIDSGFDLAAVTRIVRSAGIIE